jgi:hypothetical protein
MMFMLLKCLLLSLKCLLDYSSTYPTDVYFGTHYRRVKELAGEEAKVIFLQMCWDGADMHNKTYNNKSIWPIFYCIMNLPPSMRTVVHVGMHMAGLDLGSMCSLDIFADELLNLWTEGFTVDGQLYKVFLIEILTDSRGREKLMRVQGAGSYAGCSKCDFPGRTFGGTRVYDGWRRYCEANDPRRAKLTARNSLHQVINLFIPKCP